MGGPKSDRKGKEANATYATHPTRDEWKAFQASMENMLQSQFRKQELFIQRCMERWTPSNNPHGVLAKPEGVDEATTPRPACVLTKPESVNEGWQVSMEASMRRIEDMLQDKLGMTGLAFNSDPLSPGEPFSPKEGTANVPRVHGQERKILRKSGSSESLASLESAGTFRGVMASEGESEVASQASDRNPWVRNHTPGCSTGSRLTRQNSNLTPVNSGSGSKRAELRRSNNLRVNKLSWQISLQDRESANELASSRSDHLSLKEKWDIMLFKWLDWWMQLEEPERTGCLAKVVLTKKFDMVCAAVIVGNAVFAAYTTNYEIENLQEEPTFSADVVETIFLGFYVVELMSKFVVHRQFFFCNDDMKWNIFDLCLVLISVYYQVSLWALSAGGIDLSYMRTLRILKLARILRIVRVAKIFTELRLMLNSILGSFVHLFWSFVMLGFVFYIFGLVFVQGTTTYLIQNPDIDSGERYLIVKNFGSVERAMLSLYKATTGGIDWENLFDAPIIENMGTMNVLLFIFLIAFIQVALLNILTGVFVENALKLAKPDRETMALEHRKKEMSEAQELRDLCNSMDIDNSGTIDPEEFCANFRSGKLRAHLQVLGLHIKDAEMFFEILLGDNSAREVSIDEFVAGCMRLRGTATGLDLESVLHLINCQNSYLRRFSQACEFRFNELSYRFNEAASKHAKSSWWSGEAGGSEGSGARRHTSQEEGVSGLVRVLT
eukprot:CAMPEP_0179106120 /NCGR_PEP_ID=MMETSP0796-20121207/49319_1 /TAXON_ID=73915 /ORGANISM="Pyrodinium bahamense, Strain pbaha01" /LENGTH=722 /DNA_ID=CAMNT_0020804127 /DNA_START=40 /DNA_END=2208 /DNA_ORIENTATION=-